MSKRLRVDGTVALSADTRACVCSFLDPYDLSRATSVSKSWHLVRQRPWAVNMLGRGDKRSWCDKREAELESKYNATSDLLYVLVNFDFYSPDRIQRCDQKYFTRNLIINAFDSIAWIDEMPFVAASMINPFRGIDWLTDGIERSSAKEEMWDLVHKFNAMVAQMVPFIDRLSLAEFKTLWGSHEDGDVTWEQSLGHRKRRLSWISQ